MTIADWKEERPAQFGYRCVKRGGKSAGTDREGARERHLYAVQRNEEEGGAVKRLRVREPKPLSCSWRSVLERAGKGLIHGVGRGGVFPGLSLGKTNTARRGEQTTSLRFPTARCQGSASFSTRCELGSSHQASYDPPNPYKVSAEPKEGWNRTRSSRSRHQQTGRNVAGSMKEPLPGQKETGKFAGLSLGMWGLNPSEGLKTVGELGMEHGGKIVPDSRYAAGLKKQKGREDLFVPSNSARKGKITSEGKGG